MTETDVRIQTRTFWLPKEGHGAEAYEDAYAVSEPGRWPFRAAVADGATETAFAAPWARALAESYAATGAEDAGAFGALVRARRGEWKAAVAARLPALPWYAAEKAREGAAAAFLGLSLHAGGSWQALAVGDCCLFQVREGTGLRSWPLVSPAQFHHRPVLVHSHEGPDRPPEVATGAWQPGDVFLLATDALAAWLMEHPPAPALLRTQGAFAGAVAAARRDRLLRNDDVTLIVVACRAQAPVPSR